MKTMKILGIIGIVVIGVLIVIPRNYFIKGTTKVNTETKKSVELTNGPKEINEFVENVIEVQAISGDMGNTIEYTLKDLITENEASTILNEDYTDLENIKANIQELEKKYPKEMQGYVKSLINNINNLESLSTKALPYIQEFNQNGLKNSQKEISYCFNSDYKAIGPYKVNKEAYEKELSNMTYEYNKAKIFIS